MRRSASKSGIMANKGGKKQQQPQDNPGFSGFVLSKALWVNVLAAGVLVLLLALGMLASLKGYTHHNRYITVPDCSGLTLEQATELLERRSLRAAVMDSLYDPALLPLSVMAQHPPASAEVKQDRVIHLTVNKTRPQMIEVPVAEVVEKTLRSVQFNLQGKGFRLGELIYRPGPFDNQVLELRRGGSPHALIPGDVLPKGAVIDLVVSDGYGNSRVALPDLSGLSLSEAIFVLNANNLMEGSVVWEPGTDSSLARVYRQLPDPALDSTVREGTVVNLWMGDYPRPELEY
jgi:beta-lactam-binding protein with PASTA domain